MSSVVCFGGNCEKVTISEVKLKATPNSPKEAWQLSIHETGEGRTVYFTDGSMSDKGKVGAGWSGAFGAGEGYKAIGSAATVWDRGIGGLKGALRVAPADKKDLHTPLRLTGGDCSG